jgi:hypothetical protein
MSHEIDIEVEYLSAEWLEPIATQYGLVCGISFDPCKLPKIAQVTATYTGSEPGGVVDWAWCDHPDPLRLCTDGVEPTDGLAPPPCAAIPCGVGVFASPDTGGSTDGSTPIHVVSATTTQSVARFYLGRQQNPNGPNDFVNTLAGQKSFDYYDVFFEVGAQTAGGWERQSGKVAQCDHRVIDNSAGKLTTQHSIGCPWWKYSVIYHNAGPYAPGDQPSDEGVVATVTFTRCEPTNNTAHPLVIDMDYTPCCGGDGSLVSPEVNPTKLCRDWLLPGAPCTGGTIAPLGDLDCVPRMLPAVGWPKMPEAWVDGLVTPAIVPVYPRCGNWPSVPTVMKNANDFRVVQIALGKCVTALATTPQDTWDLPGTDGLGPTTEYQNACRLNWPEVLNDDAGLLTNVYDNARIEVFLVRGEDGHASTAAQKAARAQNVKLVSTGDACISKCCGCNELFTAPIAARVAYIEGTQKFTQTCQTYDEPYRREQFGFCASCGTAVNHELVGYDQGDISDDRCGVTIGWVPVLQNGAGGPVGGRAFSGFRLKSFLDGTILGRPEATNVGQRCSPGVNQRGVYDTHAFSYNANCDDPNFHPCPPFVTLCDVDCICVSYAFSDGCPSLDQIPPYWANEAGSTVACVSCVTTYPATPYCPATTVTTSADKLLSGVPAPSCLEWLYGPFTSVASSTSANEPGCAGGASYTLTSYSRSGNGYSRAEYGGAGSSDFCAWGDPYQYPVQPGCDFVDCSGSINFTTIHYDLPLAALQRIQAGLAPGTTCYEQNAEGGVTLTLCVPASWIGQPPPTIRRATGKYEAVSDGVVVGSAAGTYSPGATVYAPVITTCPYCLPIDAILSAGGFVFWNHFTCSHTPLHASQPWSVPRDPA